MYILVESINYYNSHIDNKIENVKKLQNKISYYSGIYPSGLYTKDMVFF